MNAWKVILATLVIFAAGIVTGALYFGHDRSSLLPATAASAAVPATASNPRDASHSINPPGPLLPMLRKDFLKTLDQEVQLTAEERDHIEKILAQGQEHTKALWDQIAPDIKQECHQTKLKIEGELNPDQVVRYEAMIKRRKAEQAKLDQAACETNAAPDTTATATP